MNWLSIPIAILIRVIVLGFLVLILAIGIVLLLTNPLPDARVVAGEMVFGSLIIFSLLLKLRFWG